MSQTTPSLSQPGTGTKPTNFRWVVCALLFYATTVNYIDRSTLNGLAPTLKTEIGWNDIEYGLIGAAFSAAYALGFIFMGRLIEILGVRLGYTISIIFWTISAICTVFTSTPLTFGTTRFFLAFGESGNFPAAIKAVAEWFPQRQRAMATGIFNAGSNVGAILAPIIAAIALAHFSWRAAFVVTPVLSGLWVILWWGLYRHPSEHRSVNKAERDLILEENSHQPQGFPVVTASVGAKPQALDYAAGAQATAEPPPIRWRNLLPHRQAWAFVMGKFLTDPVWWFYLFWSGTFFNDQYHVDIKSGLAGPLILIYVIADIGSIAGGWMSSKLLRMGWSPNAARKTTMVMCAALVLPVIFAPWIPDQSWGGFRWGMWLAATVIGVAAGAHQGFSANLFTLTSDLFPKRSVSSLVALGGLAGGLGGMIMQSASGVLKEVTGSWTITFLFAGTTYCLAVVVIHLLAPRIVRLTDQQVESKSLSWYSAAALWAMPGAVAGLFLSYLMQNHAYRYTDTFGHYIYSIIKGDIFRLPAITTTTPATMAALFHTERSQMLGPLWYTPLLAAAGAVVLGAILHGLILRPKAVAA